MLGCVWACYGRTEVVIMFMRIELGFEVRLWARGCDKDKGRVVNTAGIMRLWVRDLDKEIDRVVF